jgi:hypothetical protein
VWCAPPEPHAQPQPWRTWCVHHTAQTAACGTDSTQRGQAHST